MTTEAGHAGEVPTLTAQPERLGPRFWNLAGSSALSNLADGMFKIALPLIAIDFTRSPGLVAGIELVRTLPWLLCALPIGAFADRLDRKRTMIAANIVRAATLVIAAGAIGGGFGSIGLLYVAAICTGIAEVFYDTSAQSILPAVVPRRLLGRANGRLAAVEQGAQQFVGPPFAGVLVAIAMAAAFWTAAALWIGAIVLLWTLRGNFKPERRGPARTVRSDIAEGVRFLATNPLLRLMAVMVGVVNLAFSAATAVIVLFAVGEESAMGLTDSQFGLLILSSAIGSVGATFLYEPLALRIGRARTLTLSILGMALWVGVPAATANVWLVAVAILVGGLMAVMWNIPTVSFRQAVTPDALLGRVNSVYRLLAWGTMPLGAGLGGVLAEWFGIRAVFVVAGALSLSLLIPMLFITDERLIAAEVGAATDDDAASPATDA